MDVDGKIRERGTYRMRRLSVALLEIVVKYAQRPASMKPNCLGSRREWVGRFAESDDTFPFRQRESDIMRDELCHTDASV